MNDATLIAMEIEETMAHRNSTRIGSRDYQHADNVLAMLDVRFVRVGVNGETDIVPVATINGGARTHYIVRGGYAVCGAAVRAAGPPPVLGALDETGARPDCRRCARYARLANHHR